MSALEEYRKMTEVKHDASYLSQHTTHHADCGCITKAADAAIAELQATIKQWQEMYREMHAAVEHLHERLSCMAPSDTEAKCLSLVEKCKEQQATIERLQSLVAVEQGSSMAVAIWKQRAEQAEAALAERDRMLRLAASDRVWRYEAPGAGEIPYSKGEQQQYIEKLRARAETKETE